MAAIAVVHENERLHALDVEYRLTAVPRADSGAHCWHYLLWISGAAHQNFGGRSRSLRERHIRCRFRLTAEPVLDVAANANHRHPARSAFSQTDMLADGMSGRPVIPGHSFAEDHRRGASSPSCSAIARPSTMGRARAAKYRPVTERTVGRGSPAWGSGRPWMYTASAPPVELAAPADLTLGDVRKLRSRES